MASTAPKEFVETLSSHNTLRPVAQNALPCYDHQLIRTVSTNRRSIILTVRSTLFNSGSKHQLNLEVWHQQVQVLTR